MLLLKFADDKRTGGEINNDRTGIETKLDLMVRWAHLKIICFNKAKSNDLYLGTKNVGHTYRIGLFILENRDSVKDLWAYGIPTEHEVSVMQ